VVTEHPKRQLQSLLVLGVQGVLYGKALGVNTREIAKIIFCQGQKLIEGLRDPIPGCLEQQKLESAAIKAIALQLCDYLGLDCRPMSRPKSVDDRI